MKLRIWHTNIKLRLVTDECDMTQKRLKKSELNVEFPGYDPYNCQEQFFQYPMILENYWWAMSGSEQKVLTFIIRKTFGWQKQSDSIALSQFTDGDGTGNGTGLSRAQVKRAIELLEKKGFIKVTRRDRRPSNFELPLSEQGQSIVQKQSVHGQVINHMYRTAFNAEYMKEIGGDSHRFSI